MKVEILKVKEGIIEPLGGNDMPACMTGCGMTACGFPWFDIVASPWICC